MAPPLAVAIEDFAAAARGPQDGRSSPATLPGPTLPRPHRPRGRL